MNRSERQTLCSTPRSKWSINSRSRHRQTPAGETWGATDLRTTNLMQAQDVTQRQVTREAGEEVWSHGRVLFIWSRGTWDGILAPNPSGCKNPGYVLKSLITRI